MTEILIRKAEKKDLPAIQRLLSTYFLDIEELEPEDFVLAEEEGKVVGCAALIRNRSGEKTFMELHSIAVHPNLRGKGIGTRLMEYLINTIDEPEISEAPALELYVRTTAPGFFEKLGFIMVQNTEKLLLWEDCRNCEHFGKCAQHSMRYFRVS
ncbi:TPA: GNAT family N-acetyltransferase [Methanosarcina acetivorans]|uniref:Acetyltransferase (GNAT) family protein n=2 Tax=Methanosarcina acetivorans TaxID=2214 RepID=Q8TU35_METAC|nr:GNAT family N-acetyltransferase [Methanosarcina acetivorans]AAM03692.1 acetyltransferase (GNAT) family protein [Methanosarcina acetivorans C2A]HIH95132.1 GNAT family N-acetyltransferase [Methanosarcina acetivorans]